MYSKVMLSTENLMCKISTANILIYKLYCWCEAHSCSNVRTPHTANTGARSQPCTAVGACEHHVLQTQKRVRSPAQL